MCCISSVEKEKGIEKKRKIQKKENKKRSSFSFGDDGVDFGVADSVEDSAGGCDSGGAGGEDSGAGGCDSGGENFSKYLAIQLQ